MKHCKIVTAIFTLSILGIAAADLSKCRGARLFDHYKAKECTPVFEDGNDCPVRFDCTVDFMPDDSVCYYNGKTYKPNETIPNPDPCQKCICESSEKTEVHCEETYRICGSSLDINYKFSQGCVPVNSKNKCCAEWKYCGVSIESDPSVPRCEFNGKIYHIGEKIYPDNYTICFCDENWSGISDVSCRREDCMFEIHRPELKEGCVPIYIYEGNSCPFKYYCDSTLAEIIPGPNSLGNLTPDLKNQCVFKDKRGNIGDILDLSKDEEMDFFVCLVCKCLTPPEFMCEEIPDCYIAQAYSLL